MGCPWEHVGPLFNMPLGNELNVSMLYDVGPGQAFLVTRCAAWSHSIAINPAGLTPARSYPPEGTANPVTADKPGIFKFQQG